MAFRSQGTLKDTVTSSRHNVPIPGGTVLPMPLAPKLGPSQPISSLLIERARATYSTTLEYIILTSV
jgi:hypothetical protein